MVLMEVKVTLLLNRQKNFMKDTKNMKVKKDMKTMSFKNILLVYLFILTISIVD